MAAFPSVDPARLPNVTSPTATFEAVQRRKQAHYDRASERWQRNARTLSAR